MLAIKQNKSIKKTISIRKALKALDTKQILKSIENKT
jgi:hypothetical protein